MNRNNFLPFFIGILTIFSSPVFLHSQDGEQLLKKMDDIMFGAMDRQGKVTITLVSKSGKEKVREATMMQKGTDKKLYRYTQPESQAGVATLSLPGDVMWLYMPAFGKPKKISLLAKSQAFTGTDFSYEDMATTPYSDRYSPVLVGNDNQTYQLHLKPLDDKSSYSKILVTLDKTNYYPVKMEYFDRGGNKFKEAVYEYKKSGKYWYAGTVVMTNLKKQHSTQIELSDMLFDQGIPDEEFTVEKLAPPEKED